MIRRLTIDNFRCYVNFDTELRQQVLVAGANGVGKTTLFVVLDSLKRFLTQGQTTSEVFLSETLTRWQTSPMQTFEVEIEEGGELFRYHLEIEHERENHKSRVHKEELWVQGQPLFQFHLGEAKLYRDDYTPGPVVPLDWSRSGLGFLFARAHCPRTRR